MGHILPHQPFFSFLEKYFRNRMIALDYSNFTSTDELSSLFARSEDLWLSFMGYIERPSVLKQSQGTRRTWEANLCAIYIHYTWQTTRGSGKFCYWFMPPLHGCLWTFWRNFMLILWNTCRKNAFFFFFTTL